jgi:hypothetical protein
MKRLLAIVFALLLTLPTAALAQTELDYLGEWWNPQALAKYVFPGMDEEWLRVPEVFYYVIFPFFTAFVVIYGILKELNIFRTWDWKLHSAISFCFAFLLLPSGILTYIVNIFYAFGAFVGLMGFGVLFIVGTLFWVLGRGRGLYYEADRFANLEKGLRNDLNDIDSTMERVRNDIMDERKQDRPSQSKLKRLEKQLVDLRREREKIKDKIERVSRPI